MLKNDAILKVSKYQSIPIFDSSGDVIGNNIRPTQVS